MSNKKRNSILVQRSTSTCNVISSTIQIIEVIIHYKYLERLKARQFTKTSTFSLFQVFFGINLVQDLFGPQKSNKLEELERRKLSYQAWTPGRKKF
jgi:hypothetical protein